MFKPLFLFLGFKYTFASSKEKFISFVSMSALGGLVLGVAILLTVCSVMNGFDMTIKERLGAKMHLIELEPDHQINNWNVIVKKLKDIDGIKSIAKYQKVQGAISYQNNVVPVYLLGVENKDLAHFNAPNIKLDKFAILLNSSTKLKLMLAHPDKVFLILPHMRASFLSNMPVFKRFMSMRMNAESASFNVSGFIRADTAQLLTQKHFDGISLKLDSKYLAQNVSYNLYNLLGDGWQVYNWSNRYSELFKAIAMEKTMMIIVLSLLIIMACFSLLSSLVMLVNDKQKEIAILRTMGMSRLSIMAIFITCGVSIGLVGSFFGAILGVVLSLNIGSITNFVEKILGITLISRDVYWVDTLPSHLLWHDLYVIILVSLVLCFISTLYPAFKAANLSPSEVLRS